MHNVHQIALGSSVLSILFQDNSLVLCRLHPSLCNAIPCTWPLEVIISGVDSTKPYRLSVVLSRAWGCCLGSHGDFAGFG